MENKIVNEHRPNQEFDVLIKECAVGVEFKFNFDSDPFSSPSAAIDVFYTLVSRLKEYTCHQSS